MFAAFLVDCIVWYKAGKINAKVPNQLSDHHPHGGVMNSRTPGHDDDVQTPEAEPLKQAPWRVGYRYYVTCPWRLLDNSIKGRHRACSSTESWQQACWRVVCVATECVHTLTGGGQHGQRCRHTGFPKLDAAGRAVAVFSHYEPSLHETSRGSQSHVETRQYSPDRAAQSLCRPLSSVSFRDGSPSWEARCGRLTDAKCCRTQWPDYPSK